MRKIELIPDGRDRQGELWTTLEAIYLCGNWGRDRDKQKSIANKLGRSHGTCLNKINTLKKQKTFTRLRREWDIAE